MTGASRLLLSLVLAVSAGAVRAAETVRPGYWESTDRVLSPVRKTTVERRCVTKADIAKFMMGPSNHIYACAYPEQSVGGGVITFKGRCADKKGTAFDISGRGAYTATTLHLIARVSLAAIPMLAGVASTDARRIGDVCPSTSK
ncbi:MAG: DUF3617 family protein [Caulobacteraceae bacterium]